ncbi:hypothetical protein ACSSS7_005348 [Eimeria intestinalis]
MAPARLFFFTAASLVLLDLTVAAQQNDRKVIIKKGIICLTELNGARQKAGLTKLASSADLIKDEAAPSGQETAPSGIWDPVCKTLLDVGLLSSALVRQDEWNGIKKILSSSAAAAVPSLLGLATLLAAAFLS